MNSTGQIAVKLRSKAVIRALTEGWYSKEIGTFDNYNGNLTLEYKDLIASSLLWVNREHIK